MVEKKICRKCGEEKEFGDYYQDRNARDGRRSSCIECDKARKRTDAVREQSKRYYHSEKGKAAERVYIQSGKKSEAAKTRQQRPEVKEALKKVQPTYSRRYYQSEKGRESSRRNHNSERYRNQMRQHRSRPEIRERMRAYGRIKTQERNALKRQLPATFTAADWLRAQEYFQHRCVYCGLDKPLAQDHFIPVASRGPYSPHNIVPACKRCNTSKLNRDPQKWCPPETYARIMDYFYWLRGLNL